MVDLRADRFKGVSNSEWAVLHLTPKKVLSTGVCLYAQQPERKQVLQAPRQLLPSRAHRSLTLIKTHTHTHSH